MFSTQSPKLTSRSPTKRTFVPNLRASSSLDGESTLITESSSSFTTGGSMQSTGTATPPFPG